MLNFEKFNRHWQDGFSYEFEKKRLFFDKILQFLPKRQIVAITGLRRTGKTVLLKQAINHLISEGIPRKNILYFSFDEQKAPLDGLLSEYRAASGVDIEKEKIFVFLDEVQKTGNWQEQVKTYYDNYSNLKFFVSGSSSLFINKKADESLAGRIYLLDLPIISFREFLDFSGKSGLAQKPQMHTEALRHQLSMYAKRSFIEIIGEDEESARFYMESILNKIVYEDIPSLFPVEYPEKLKALAAAIYSSPGMLINYGKIGTDLGLNPRTAEKYLNYLVKAKLVKKIYNYSRNFLTSEKKAKKAYITAPCFCFLAESPAFSKIAENIIALDARIGFFWRTPQKEEIDFILKTGSGPLPVESKYSAEIGKREYRAIEKFCRKYGARQAVIITKNDEKTTNSKETAVKLVPLWKWLLQ